MQKLKNKRIGKLIWGAVTVLLWVGVGVLFYRTNGALTAEELLRYQPENKGLAVLSMAALYFIKSVDFVLPAGALYTMDGIMFPLPAAMAVNILGIGIMSVVPYEIGRAFGPDALAWLTEKYPRLRRVTQVRGRSLFVVTLLLRCFRIPINAVGLYAGAKEYRRAPYLLASLLGLMPSMVPYTLFGLGAGNLRSPALVISIAAELAVTAGAVVYARFSAKKRTSAAEAAEARQDAHDPET